MLGPFLNGSVDQNRPPDLDAGSSAGPSRTMHALSEFRYPNALPEAASTKIQDFSHCNSRTLARYNNYLREDMKVPFFYDSTALAAGFRLKCI
jgi:hypothetical protein